jgi:riboflavin kinase / FMN adenylyltransferase
MRVHHHWQDIGHRRRGASVAMGNFDGLHLGHQSVIDLARRPGPHNVPLGIVTFEPHPRQVFAPDAPPFRLMNAEARANRLAKLGVDRSIQLPFDRTLAGLTPEEFRARCAGRMVLAFPMSSSGRFLLRQGPGGTAADLRPGRAPWALTSPSPPLSRWTGSKSRPPRSGR